MTTPLPVRLTSQHTASSGGVELSEGAAFHCATKPQWRAAR